MGEGSVLGFLELDRWDVSQDRVETAVVVSIGTGYTLTFGRRFLCWTWASCWAWGFLLGLGFVVDLGVLGPPGSAVAEGLGDGVVRIGDGDFGEVRDLALAATGTAVVLAVDDVADLGSDVGRRVLAGDGDGERWPALVVADVLLLG
jgi:hypothetical protein